MNAKAVVNLIRIKDNQPVQKSLQNWNALPRKQKDAYRVVGEDGVTTKPVAVESKELIVPEEVKLLRQKKSEAKEVKAEAVEPSLNDNEKKEEPKTVKELTEEANVVKRYDELTGEHAERRKALANEFGMHWRKVDTILSDAGKK